MRPARRQPVPLTRLVWAAILVLLVLGVGLQRASALSRRAPLGQTIPPLPTATRTVPLEPTATWTAHPTWTPAATPTPQPPTHTATTAAIPPTTTPAPDATATALPLATVTRTPLAATATLIVPKRDVTPSATPPAAAIPLAFDVVVIPPVAGPGDVVQFVLQLANVGYGPVDSVLVEVVSGEDLSFRLVQCSRCVVDCPQCAGRAAPARLAIFIDRLVAGDQLIAPVEMEVSADAWPGQTLRSEWKVIASGLPAQTVQAGVVLPWAQLPATGGE